MIWCSSASTTTSSNRPTCSCATYPRSIAIRHPSSSPTTTASTSGCTRSKQAGVSGLNAVVSWPAEEWGRDPAGFAEMRPGVYDVHERVRDMSRNGIWGSMCFPTFTGFSARHLNQYQDPVTLVMVSAYNDWHIDEWCGAYPERFVLACAAAHLERRGDVRGDPPGGRQGAAARSPCRRSRTWRACRATTTSTTGDRCSRPCPTPG